MVQKRTTSKSKLKNNKSSTFGNYADMLEKQKQRLSINDIHFSKKSPIILNLC